MGVKGSLSLLSHLAIGLAGWGMAGALKPLLPVFDASGVKSGALRPTKTDRPTPDATAGTRLLEHLRRGLPRHESTEDLPKDELSFEEEVRRRVGRIASEPNLDGIRAEVASDRISHHLIGEQGPNLIYAFRKGRMDALEVREQLAARIPELVGLPEFLPSLYKILAANDPQRAEGLLKHLPEQDRSYVKSRWIHSDNAFFEPEVFLLLMQTIPLSSTPQMRAERLGLWEASSPRLAGYYGAEYQRWIEDQPNGQDRDMALFHLAKLKKPNDPAEADRLRGLIGDPEIRDLP